MLPIPPQRGGYSAEIMTICIRPVNCAASRPLELIVWRFCNSNVKMEPLLRLIVKEQSPDPVRFGAEFGPKRSQNSTGVSLSTFKTLVWVSNLGGLLLFAIGLELMIVKQQFYFGLGSLVAGVIIALFPSNYEIVGMEEPNETTQG